MVQGSVSINRISKSTNPSVEGTGTDGTDVASGKNYLLTYGGGAIDTDNSGELRYVRVEFAPLREPCPGALIPPFSRMP